MKTRLLIIIGTITAIIISISALIIIDNIEDKSTTRPTTIYETDQQYQIVMNHCINNFDLDGVDQSYFNNTHYIWTGECAWKLLNDPAAFSHAISLTEQYYYLSPYYFEGQTADFEIQYLTASTCPQSTSEKPHEDAVWNLDECYWFVDDPYIPYELQLVLDDCGARFYEPDIKLTFTNDTHQINNVDCEWQTPPKGNFTSFSVDELEPDDLPQFALDCAVTHKFSQETQNCEIWWNSIYVVQLTIVVFFIIIISVIVIIYYWRIRK